jgi:hypothetical protein
VSCASRLEIQSRPNGWQAQVATMTAGLKSTHIILYCNSGVRAEAAKMVLEVQGYTAVTNGGSYADRGMMENECAACAMGGKAAAGGGRLLPRGHWATTFLSTFRKQSNRRTPGMAWNF